MQNCFQMRRAHPEMLARGYMFDGGMVLCFATTVLARKTSVCSLTALLAASSDDLLYSQLLTISPNSLIIYKSSTATRWVRVIYTHLHIKIIQLVPNVITSFDISRLICNHVVNKKAESNFMPRLNDESKQLVTACFTSNNLYCDNWLLVPSHSGLCNANSM